MCIHLLTYDVNYSRVIKLMLTDTNVCVAQSDPFFSVLHE